MNRSKIDKVTLSALRTRQSLVKGERLVRHEMRAVLSDSGAGQKSRKRNVGSAGGFPHDYDNATGQHQRADGATVETAPRPAEGID